MEFSKSKHYFHHNLLEKGLLRAKPILICGSSGTGKSFESEIIKEHLRNNDKNTITFEFYDADDVFEPAFCMFPATDRHHVNTLKFFHLEPKAKTNVKIHYIMGSQFPKIAKKSYPKGNIITFSTKKILQREECMFLLEKKDETKSVKLMLKSGEKLKSDEDIRFVKKYTRDLTQRKHQTYMGKTIEIEDDTIADKSDEKDVRGALQLFDTEKLIMPDNFETNLNPKALLNDKGATHVFIYKGLKKDNKLKHFCFFHIFNEISRNLSDCKYKVVFDIEEAQTLAPDSKEGYSYIMGKFIGDKIGLLRKSARGVWILIKGRVWSKISFDVRSECKKQVIFHLEQDDMLKYVKVRNLKKSQKEIIENLATGECVLRGYESRVIMVRPPSFGHKIETMDFVTEYKKHFPDGMIDFTDTIQKILSEEKDQEKNYKLYLNKLIEKKKANIRKIAMQKNKTEKTGDQIKRYQEEDKMRKEEERNKRDEEIIKIYNELKKNPDEKVSYRIVSKKLEEKNIYVSYVTVKNVIDSYSTTEGDKENTVN